MLAGMVCCAGALSVGVAEKISIDGKLDEPSWEQTPKASNFTMLTLRWPKQPKPLADTSFSVLADRDHIYIGIRCEEPNMDKLRADAQGAGNLRLWADDAVEIYFSPTGSPDEYYQFAVGAGGATFQMFYGEKGVIRPDDYSPIYEAKTFHGNDFWSTEIKIPLEAFYMTKSKFWKSDWLFNVSRQRMNPKTHSWSSWAVLKNAFNEVERFHKVGKFPMKPAAKDIYIKEISGKLATSTQGGLILKTQQEKSTAGTYTLSIESDALEPITPSQVTLREGENRLVIPSVTFKKTGKINVTAVITNQHGQTVAARGYQTPLEFVPMRLDLTAPAYGNAFFPGQPSDRLQGELHFTLPVQSVRITQNGKTTEIPVKSQTAEFDLPIEFPADQSLPVKFEVFQDGKNIFCREITIRRLPPRPHTMVWIVPPGRLVVNGKNTFIHGWYGGQGDWIVSNWLKEKYPTQNDKHPVNMTRWVNLQVNRLLPGTEARESTRDVLPSKEVLEAVRKRIEDNRNSDFEIYYLEDEPECRGVSSVYLKHVYEYVKELDPYHPVMIISRDPGKYVDCADILNPHPYLNPIVNEDGRRILKSDVETIRRRCREISNTGRKNKIIMLTPQAFSYNIVNTHADYTTFDETNASIWSAICHNAQGITAYIWYAHLGRPSLNFGMDYIYTSLERLNHLLASSEAPLPVGADNPLVDVRCVVNSGQYLLAVVNVSPQSQTAIVKFASAPSVDRWFGFRENQQLTIPENGLKIDLAPYQVLLLTSQKLDERLSSLSDLRGKIVEAEHERRNRGNLLFGKHRDIEVSSSYSKYNYQAPLEQQDCLFDGIIDSAAWIPRQYEELWYELAFPKFVPRFSKARIYGNGLQGMTLKIWKHGEWQTPSAQITDSKYCREYNFEKMLSTVKIRMEFQKPQPDSSRFELYEFELLK